MTAKVCVVLGHIQCEPSQPGHTHLSGERSGMRCVVAGKLSIWKVREEYMWCRSFWIMMWGWWGSVSVWAASTDTHMRTKGQNWTLIEVQGTPFLAPDGQAASLQRLQQSPSYIKDNTNTTYEKAVCVNRFSLHFLGKIFSSSTSSLNIVVSKIWFKPPCSAAG